MATGGRSNIEVTANTKKARKTMGDFFRDMENVGKKSLQVLNAIDPFDDLSTSAKNTTGVMKKVSDSAKKLDGELDKLGDGNKLDEMGRDVKKADKHMDELEDAAKDVDGALEDATGEMKDFGDAAVKETGAAEGSVGKLGGKLKTFVGVLAAAFAVDKIKDFGFELAATAGSAKAVEAQFSTVFGDMEGEAAERLGAISGEASILENRMKESFTKIAAFAKTGGMDTADSLNLADRSMRAIADSAAFYDRSLEDTTESLQSFLKGNYENDAALGLSATETSRNAAANELYGKSFNDLDEAQKQLTLLQMVEDANKVSGALGQAARESDGWENVMGNMSQAWEDFKAKIGTPVLAVAVKGIQAATGALQKIDADAIGDKIGATFDWVSGAIGRAKDAIDPFRRAFGALRDVMSGEDETVENIFWAWGLGPDTWSGVTTAIQSMKDTFIDFKNSIMPILKQAGDYVQQYLIDLWPRVKTGVGIALSFVAGYIQTLRDNWDKHGSAIFNRVKEVLIDLWPSVKSAVSGVVSFIGNMVGKIVAFWQSDGQQIMDAVRNVFDFILNIIEFVMPFVLALIKSVWGNIQGVITGALDIIMGVVKIFSGLFTGDFKKMWEGVKQLFFGAVNFIWNFVQLTFYGKILGGAKAFILSFRTFFTEMWKAVVTLFKGNATAAYNIVKTAFTSIFNASKTIFTNVINFFKGIWSTLKSITSGTINFLKTAFTTGFSAMFRTVKTGLGNIKTWFTNIFRDVYNAVKGRFSDIVALAKGLPKRIGDGIGKMASKVVSGTTKVINSLAQTLGKGVNGVIGGVNWVLGKIGVDKKNYIDEWPIPEYAHGTDSHPGGLAKVNDGKGANAGPEMIIGKDGQMKMAKKKNAIIKLEKGAQVLSAINTKKLLNSIPAYAKGKGMFNSLLDKGKEAATHVWEGGKNFGKKVVNTAFDVFDYIKDPSKLLDIALDTLGFNKPEGSSFIANMAKGAWNKVKSGAVGFVKGKLDGFGDDGGPAPGFGRLFGKSSSYGWRMHPILKKRIFHNGADYPAPAGALIKAQAAGKVIQSAFHSIRGNYVRIKSGIMERIYQHNTRNLVGTGDMVRKGQGIATVGSTGRSTGPHLHYEVLRNGKNINPEGFFKGGIVKAKQLAWIAEKGMEAIIPLVTNRAEGIDLWKRVGQHFGFDMDSMLNSGDYDVSYAGNGTTALDSASSVGSSIKQSFGSSQKTGSNQPIHLTVSVPLNDRVLVEETFELTHEMIEQKKGIEKQGRRGKTF